MQMNAMMLKNPYDTYRQQGVMMANPAELIVMLYDGLRKNLMLAQKDLEVKHDLAAAHKHFMKAQDIVNELLGSLDMSFSLSKSLMALYEFMLNAIAEMNLKKDASGMEPLLEIINELRETWQQVSEQAKTEMLMTEAAPVTVEEEPNFIPETVDIVGD